MPEKFRDPILSLSFPSHLLKYIQFHCPENIFLNLHFTGFWDRLILFYSPITFLMRKSLSAGIDIHADIGMGGASESTEEGGH